MKTVLIVGVFCFATIAFAQENDCDSREKCQEAVKANSTNSLAHFRIAEFYFRDHNFLSSANEFREALTGNLQPRWIEVWAHINLGKILDLTGQRDRALNEYRLALRTGDNTRGAQGEAERLQ